MDLDTEITVKGDIMGIMREEITGSKGREHHHLTLLAIEIGSESSQVEFREEGTLKHGVDTMHRAELGLLYLVVQHASIARSFHHHDNVQFNSIRSETTSTTTKP